MSTSDREREHKPRLYIRKRRPVRLAFFYGDHRLVWVLFIILTGLPLAVVTGMAGSAMPGVMYTIVMAGFYLTCVHFILPGANTTVLAWIYRRLHKMYCAFIGDNKHYSDEPLKGERFTREPGSSTK